MLCVVQIGAYNNVLSCDCFVHHVQFEKTDRVATHLHLEAAKTNEQGNLQINSLLEQESEEQNQLAASFREKMVPATNVPQLPMPYMNCNFETQTMCNSVGSQWIWGCCPFAEAVCCPDRTTCCPGGTECATKEGWCTGNRNLMVREGGRRRPIGSFSVGDIDIEVSKPPATYCTSQDLPANAGRDAATWALNFSKYFKTKQFIFWPQSFK